MRSMKDDLEDDTYYSIGIIITLNKPSLEVERINSCEVNSFS
jgi:hypothetical protein